MSPNEIKLAMEYLPGDVFCPIPEFKFEKIGDEHMTFEGHGAVFNNLDANRDVIAPGAFTKTLKEAKKTGIFPAMLMQHGGFGLTAEDMTPIGAWINMEEDAKGLNLRGKLADTPRGQEAHTLMKMTPRPAITGLSIGFIPKEFTLGTKPEEPRRTLKKIELIEVSLVTFPANGKARVRSVKSGLDIRVADHALRDAGFSRSETKAICAAGFGALIQIGLRDVDDLDKLAQQMKRNIETLSN